jgi:hypothetical protein
VVVSTKRSRGGNGRAVVCRDKAGFSSTGEKSFYAVKPDKPSEDEEEPRWSFSGRGQLWRPSGARKEDE